jgi:hypothetical protein
MMVPINNKRDCGGYVTFIEISHICFLWSFPVWLGFLVPQITGVFFLGRQDVVSWETTVSLIDRVWVAEHLFTAKRGCGAPLENPTMIPPELREGPQDLFCIGNETSAWHSS